MQLFNRIVSFKATKEGEAFLGKFEDAAYDFIDEIKNSNVQMKPVYKEMFYGIRKLFSNNLSEDDILKFQEDLRETLKSTKGVGLSTWDTIIDFALEFDKHAKKLGLSR